MEPNCTNRKPRSLETGKLVYALQSREYDCERSRCCWHSLETSDFKNSNVTEATGNIKENIPICKEGVILVKGGLRNADMLLVRPKKAAGFWKKNLKKKKKGFICQRAHARASRGRARGRGSSRPPPSREALRRAPSQDPGVRT